MKKIMIALAAVALAFASQAAATKWTITNSRLPTVADKTKEWSGKTTTADAAMAMTIQLLYAGDVLATEATASAGSFVGKTAMDQAKTAEIAEKAGSNTVTFDVIAELVTDDGTYSYAGTVSGDLSNVLSGTKDVTLTGNMNNIGSWTFSPKAGPTPTPTPTPEPTSGLLLLLGMAGLALRRRRA